MHDERRTSEWVYDTNNEWIKTVQSSTFQYFSVLFSTFQKSGKQSENNIRT